MSVPCSHYSYDLRAVAAGRLDSNFMSLIRDLKGITDLARAKSSMLTHVVTMTIIMFMTRHDS